MSEPIQPEKCPYPNPPIDVSPRIVDGKYSVCCLHEDCEYYCYTDWYDTEEAALASWRIKYGK